MKRIIAVVALAVVLIGAVLFTSSHRPNKAMTDQNQQPATQAASNEPAAKDKIVIENFKFGPQKTIIKKGTTVTWTNKDEAHHNVVISSGPLAGSEGTLMAKGETYQLTFDKVGTYEYHCAPHPYMKATIVVEE